MITEHQEGYASAICDLYRYMFAGLKEPTFEEVKYYIITEHAGWSEYMKKHSIEIGCEDGL